MFRKAERKQAKLRLALCGPSGSGKTYSALLIAQGLAPDGRVALLDTERGSGELYADLMAYDVAPLEPPFTPARYIDLIREAAGAGYSVLIVDSLSHAWAGDGGILDMHDKATAANRTGNSFAAWREVTPVHNQLVDTLLGADLHLIATLRTKTAYDLVDEGNGKKKPVKIGLAPVQRDGLEYEFTLVMDLSVEGHVATATKDRTRLFDGAHFLPGRETGAALREWLGAARSRRGAGVPACGDATAGGRAEPPSAAHGQDPSGTTVGAISPSGLGKDPAEESKRLLQRLKAALPKLKDVPQLNAWWRQNAGEIAQLAPADAEQLKARCALRKSVLLTATEGPAKGNGQAVGIEALA